MVRASIRTQAGQAIVPALVDVAVGLGFFAVLIYGGPQIIAGEKTIGEFMSFFTAMSLAFQPLRRLAGIAGSYQTMMASLERIYALRDTVPTILGRRCARRGPPRAPAIAFEDVRCPTATRPVLRGVDFDVPEGTTTALVGQSGAGKSTMFNVLTRLVDPAAGRVTMGGHDIRTMPLDGPARPVLGGQPGHAPLRRDAAREPSRSGAATCREAQLGTALDAAHVTEFLADMPGGLDTPAGPRGSNLSGGQRQRIAIARALLRDTPILLLDEATSALDTRVRAAGAVGAGDALGAGRTTLVIAHRLSTIRDADQIVVLDEGRVVEHGTHDELLALGGLYTQLHALQFGALPRRTPKPRDRARRHQPQPRASPASRRPPRGSIPLQAAALRHWRWRATRCPAARRPSASRRRARAQPHGRRRAGPSPSGTCAATPRCAPPSGRATSCACRSGSCSPPPGTHRHSAFPRWLMGRMDALIATIPAAAEGKPQRPRHRAARRRLPTSGTRPRTAPPPGPRRGFRGGGASPPWAGSATVEGHRPLRRDDAAGAAASTRT